ncbi:MAG: hypothetical protein ABI114_11040 [Rhodanobacter sp.]
MNPPESYFYGQGRVSIAVRDPSTGVPGPFRWIGDVSAFSIKLTTQQVEHKESYSGQRALVTSFPSEKAANVDMTMHQMDPENLALVLYGSTTSAVAGTATAEAFPATVAVGDDVYLANPGVSALVITDSTPTTPLTLVLGTDYTVDPNFGRVTILDLGAFVQPFKAAYSYAARKSVGMFTTGQPQLAMRYEGINLAEGNAPTLVELYKVAPGVVQDLALITTGNDVAGLQITGGVLLDSSRPAVGGLGQFGAITQIGAPA